MKRECQIVRPSPDGKRAIYVDTDNKFDIKGYFFSDDRHKKKFKFFCDIFFGGHKNPILYDKEDVNDKCKDVTAIKLFKKQENDRIYCKEITSKKGIAVVVMAILHRRKKAKGNSQREISLIETVASYEYDI